MANRAEIEKTYDWIDEFHRLRLGQCADISCAYYDGLSKSLDQAQRDKHEWVLDTIEFKPGERILDIGCGWGPMLAAVRDRGGVGVGLTLSPKQAAACRSIGLDARLLDWKDADAASLGKFDGIVSLGAFEHFCSADEYRQGLQCAVYERFFRFCSSILEADRLMYLQTMTWGRRTADPDRITLREPVDSDACILARLTKFYPGSWLPTGIDQIVSAADPYFEFVSAGSGRLDYIRTLDEWGRASRRAMRSVRSWPKLARIALGFFTDRDLPQKLLSIYLGDQQQCFIRAIMDHQRIYLRARSTACADVAHASATAQVA